MKLSPAQRKVLDAMEAGKGVYFLGRFVVGNAVYHTITLRRLFGAGYISYEKDASVKVGIEITDAGRKALEGGE